MRWKLLRRRWSVSAPRVTVRSRMPWPLRWLLLALMMGCSAALALWAFEFGKEITGLDHDARTELVSLREEISRLREEHDRAVSVANTADSLLKAAQATQESLAARVKSLEAENLAMTRDLGFFEKLMPSRDDGKPLAVRGLQRPLKVSRAFGHLFRRIERNRIRRYQGLWLGQARKLVDRLSVLFGL